jgi:uncharacterized protein
MTNNPFLVNIASLRAGPGGRHHVVRSGRLGGLVVTSSSVPAPADVVVDADLEVVNGGVVVTGTVAAPWIGECRRCLGPVTGQLVAHVREVYERGTRLHRDDLEAADEAETYPLTGDTLDLEPMARDALLLELPLAPLCRPDCAGLCPTCGADLSDGPCDCADEPLNPTWAALDALRTQPGNGAGRATRLAEPGLAEPGLAEPGRAEPGAPDSE